MQYTDFNEIRVGKNNTYVKRKKRERVCVCVCVWGGGGVMMTRKMLVVVKIRYMRSQ